LFALPNEEPGSKEIVKKYASVKIAMAGGMKTPMIWFHAARVLRRTAID
jgi:hypothetical protein